MRGGLARASADVLAGGIYTSPLKVMTIEVVITFALL